MTRLGAPGRGRDPAPVRIVDVGTGSGAIIVALAVELRRRKVDLATDVTLVATDASSDALGLARENAVGHAVADVIEFVEADLLPPAPDHGGPIDVVLANLPYVRSDAIGGLPVAASFEPVIALDGGPDGLDVARRLLGLLPARPRRRRCRVARDRGGPGFGSSGGRRGDLARVDGSIEPDLAGLPRVLRVTRGDADDRPVDDGPARAHAAARGRGPGVSDRAHRARPRRNARRRRSPAS